jgi:hypothetical protein
MAHLEMKLKINSNNFPPTFPHNPPGSSVQHLVSPENEIDVSWEAQLRVRLTDTKHSGADVFRCRTMQARLVGNRETERLDKGRSCHTASRADLSRCLANKLKVCER